MEGPLHPGCVALEPALEVVQYSAPHGRLVFRGPCTVPVDGRHRPSPLPAQLDHSSSAIMAAALAAPSVSTGRYPSGLSAAHHCGGSVTSKAAVTVRTASRCWGLVGLRATLSTSTRVVYQMAQHGSSVANL